MRSYYPILSVVAALTALAVPVILIAWPFSAPPEGTAGQTSGVVSDEMQAELRRLGEALAELHRRLDELEQPVKSPIHVANAVPDTLGGSPQLPESAFLPPQMARAELPPGDGKPGSVEFEAPQSQPLASPVQVRATPSNHSPSNHSPEATVVRTAEPAGAPPAAGDAAERPLGQTSLAVSTIMQLPSNRNHLLLAARPAAPEELLVSAGVTSPTTSPAPLPAAIGEQATGTEPTNGGDIHAPLADAQPRPRERTHPPSGRKPVGRTVRQPNAAAPGTLPPEFAQLGAGGLDSWNDQPPFALSVTRPSTGLVRHWEEFVATTNVPGWPVVMVRSETEGDHWWVQQLVARQGNVIAAKVSFGNENTISGHQFDVVVLLLESSAEAVRFRTARKFQELPAGVQRSATYRYVRR